MSNNQQGINGYPSEFVDPKDKNTAWGLKYFRAMYADWQKYGLIQLRKGQIAKNRIYYDGNQPIQQYKDRFGVRNGQDSYTNVSWEIVSLIPKFIRIMIWRIMQVSDTVSVTAVDPTSQDTKQNMLARLQAEIISQKELAEINKLIGLDKDPHQALLPQDLDELEIFRQTDLKTVEEILLEEGVGEIENDNDWERLIKPDILQDLLVDGMALTRTYTDLDGTQRARRVDVENALIGTTRRKNFSDADSYGEFIYLTIAEVRRMCPDIPETELLLYAQNSGGLYGNPIWGYDYSIYSNGYWGYDYFKILVLDASFESTNIYTYEKTQNSKYGTTKVRERKMNFQPDPNTESEKLQMPPIKVWYEGMWIVQSDRMIYFKLCEDMYREKDKKGRYKTTTKPPWHVYKPSFKSITEQLINWTDKIQIADTKMQNLIAQARPKGLYIDITALSNITVDGVDWTPLKIISVYNETGNLIGNGSAEAGENAPIKELENGIGKDIMTYVNLINFYIQMMGSVCGLNEVTNASTPNPEMPVSTSEMAAQATGFALEHIWNSYAWIKESSFRYMLKQRQYQLKRGQTNGYYGGVKVAMMAYSEPNFTTCEFAIKVIPGATEQEKRDLNMRIQESLAKQSQTGSGGIEIEDAFAIERAMKVSPRLAEELMVIRRNRRRKQAQEDSAQLQQQNTQSQIQSAQAVEQAKAQSYKLQTDEDIRKIEAQGAIDFKLQQLVNEGNIQKTEVTAQAKTVHIAQEGAQLEHLQEKAQEHELGVTVVEKMTDAIQNEKDREHEKQIAKQKAPVAA